MHNSIFVVTHQANGSIVLTEGIDEKGNPVKRSKSQYPYTYDGFVVWRGIPQEELDCTLYSDRIRRQYHDDWDDLCNKHFGECGDYFNQRSPDDIEAFLQVLLGKPNYKLGLIMEYCNHSNGYPVWRFDLKIS